MLEIFGFVLIGLGCFLGLVGGLGVLRLPDMFARLHAVGITDTLCSFLILSGLACQSEHYIEVVKCALVFLFLLFSGPVSSYALANNAWRWGLSHKQKVHIVSKEKDDK